MVRRILDSVNGVDFAVDSAIGEIQRMGFPRPMPAESHAQRAIDAAVRLAFARLRLIEARYMRQVCTARFEAVLSEGGDDAARN